MNQIASTLSIPTAPEPTLPDGRRLSQVSHGELSTILDRLGIVGFSHSSGRTVNEQAYANHLARIFNTAGRLAVEQWLSEHRETRG